MNTNYAASFKKVLSLLFILTGIFGTTKASDSGSFNPGEFIMHHIADAHEIHFFTLGEGENEHHYSLYLPVILNTNDGVKVFSSSHLYHDLKTTTDNEGHEVQYGSYDGFVMTHEHIYYANEEGGLTFDENNQIINEAPLDLSITKSVAGLLLTIVLLLVIFSSVANNYKKNGIGAPKGLASVLEPLILFIRDEVAIPSIGKKKADKFLPFLLTVFFFIWIANMLGLIPFIGGFNITGTLGVTLVLAAIVFVITTINGNGHYWSHILWPSGVPLPIKFILVPIEFLGILIKPTVLMIRLTANITAGHIIILSFVTLIFIFGQSSAATGYGVGVGSLVFMIFMNFIELLVAFLQAYVFTLLAALYFGSAVEEAHH